VKTRSAPLRGPGKRRTLFAVSAFAVLAFPALTQTATPPPSSPPPAAPKSTARVVKIVHADSMLKQGSQWILLGHAHLQEGDTNFFADRIVYDEEGKKGEATQDSSVKGGSVGLPVAKDDLNALTSDRIAFDFSPKDPSRKVVSAVGHVQFIAKPRPKTPASSSATPGATETAEAAPAVTPDSAAPKEDEDAKKDRLEKRVKEVTALTCDRLDYFYRSKRAVAEGNLKVTQGKRWLTGDQAIYYERYDTVVVNGHVRGEDEKGRTFEADNLKIDMNGETDVIEANEFHGSFELEEDEESPENPADSAPPAFPGSDAFKPKPSAKK
jgi:lipopolysaccharide assembly outer membrane protein LptD (OstA)